MAIRIQLRQGTTTEHNTFTGAVGEVTVDTTKKTLRVHDGTTVGGTVLAKVSEVPSLVPQATETALGVAKIATTAIVQTGTNDTDFVTPKKLKQVAFGMGAGFVDVTSSRALNTTYTNTTNKPIIVIVSCGPSGAGFSTPQMTVNGISYKGAYSQQSNMYSFNMAVVPVGGTYSVAPVGNTGVIAFWGEF